MTRIATMGGRLLIGVALLLALAAVFPADAAGGQIVTPPDAQLTVDQTYRYQLTLEGTDGAGAVYALTNAPVGMTVSPDGVLTWSPTVPGDYRVVVGIKNDGTYDSTAFRLTVLPGAIAKIQITPNDKPTIVENRSTVQFVARAFDAKGNALSHDRFSWSISGDVGAISETGLFTAKRSAIGEVSATFGDVRGSVGVVVTGAETTPLAPQQPGQVLGEASEATEGNTDGTSPEESADNNEQLAQSTTTEEQTDACTNWASWILIGILVVYTAVLIWYYGFMRRRAGQLWWLFPILLTLIGLVIYSRYVCEGTYLWWPWVFVIIGVLLTVIYQPRVRQPQ